MHKILQVQRRRILYLSLPIDLVWHCMRYANMKVSSKPNFPVYRQNPISYTGKNVSEKTGIFAYFTYYDVWRISLISPETYTLLNKNNRHYTVSN